MLAQIRRARQDEKGFTLIELLVVIVIIGVLAGIVVFAVGGINNTARQAACAADIKTVKTAVEAYRAQNGSYPPAATVSTALVPGFLESWPSATVSYTLPTASNPEVVGVSPC